MKRPNKIERMHAYLYAWAILKRRIEQPTNQTSNFVCPMLKEYYMQTTGHIISMYNVTYLYPEFAEQKPYRVSVLDSWWADKDKQSRITALENAIKLLA